MPGINRSLKRVFTLIGISFFLLSVSAITLLYLNGDKIKQLIISELNKNLLIEVSVKKIDIGVFKSFPYASVILSDAVMQPPSKFSTAPGLIHAGTITLRFNLINLITKKYIIHSIEISNAHISIYEDGYGLNNYSIWKKSTSGEGSVEFKVKRLTLTSSKVFYRNLRRKDDFEITVKDLNLKGELQKEQFTLKAEGNCFNERLLVAGSKILPAGDTQFVSTINIDTQKQTLVFKTSTLEFAGIDTQFNGLYCYSSQPFVNFQVTSLSSDLENIKKIIPESFIDEINKYSPTGQILIHGNLSGPADQLNSIKVTAYFEIKNSNINWKTKDIKIKDVAAEGRFIYAGQRNSELLTISKFSGKFNSGNISGNSVISNFETPTVKINLLLNTDITELAPLIENEFISEYYGQVTADLKYSGQFISGSRIDRQILGQVTLNDAGFTYNNKKINNLTGSLEFNQNNLRFNGLTCSLGSSDIKANGDIENLFGYLLDGSKNIHATLRLFSDKLVLQDILDLAVEQGEVKTSTSLFPPNISFDAILSVNSLTYKKLKTNNITGTFTLKDDILRGNDISINALGGKITGNGLINGRYGNRAQIVTKAHFDRVDINRLFYEFGDFGQKSLVSDNLKGTAQVDVDFATMLYTDFTINSKSIEAIADVEIKNGELNDFEPLQALSRFLDASSLKNIKFATLKNRIEINHETVMIPQMEIQSSALNLAGYGTHTFGNDIDYHVNMLLSDVMRAKRKKQPEFDKYIEDDGYGKPRLFLKVSGEINDPLVQYDTRAVKNKIATDFKNEKQVFKDVIRKEFGTRKSETGTSTGTTPTKEPTEFQIEWDENK
ncbi:MAG: AsmA-like C-terminal region-containing protein [Omnitrophica WOR_2 bacterium]